MESLYFILLKSNDLARLPLPQSRKNQYSVPLEQSGPAN